jgi:hypothetical protein
MRISRRAFWLLPARSLAHLRRDLSPMGKHTCASAATSADRSHSYALSTGPNDKTVPLLFTAHAARDLGASRIGLVAPNLGYMRQDKRFHPGEAITSSAFGKLLSSSFDWLVTLDPHLHRRTSMSEVYSIPARRVPRGAEAVSLDTRACTERAHCRPRRRRRAMGERC